MTPNHLLAPRSFGRSSPWLLGRLALALALATTLGGCRVMGAEGNAVQRGDAAFAQGDYANALSEYRLALRQGSDEATTWLRAGHAFARANRIDEARDHYLQAIARDSTLADQAASDLLRVARRALDRRDGIVASAASDAAAALRPGVSLAGVSLDLARHHVRMGQHAAALPYFQKALGEPNGNTPEVLFELASVHEQLGDCERALGFFEQVRPRMAANRLPELDWQVGNCSFQLAREAAEEDRLDLALRLYRTVTDLGEPRNLVGQAWFEAAELMARQGECLAATSAFEAAIQAEGGSGGLANRARDRIDGLRFRSGGGEGPC